MHMDEKKGPENSNKENEFLILQFQTLRTEILDIKERIIRMLGMGLMGIPVMLSVGNYLNLKPIILASPLVTVAFMAVLLSEQNSLMRAGRYIREYIEPILGDGKTLCWEAFLEKNKENRRGEKIFAFGANLIFALYYVIGIVQSYRAARSIELNNIPIRIDELPEKFSTYEFSTFMIISFAGILLFVVNFMIREFNIGTKQPSSSQPLIKN